jgi:itaconate CoA-transferase
VARNDELTAIIEASFADLPAEKVLHRLDQAGIANARLRTPADLTRHPQLQARRRLRAVRTPGGEMDAFLPPVETDGQDPVMGPVPALGEHTEAIAAEFGVTGDQEPA